MKTARLAISIFSICMFPLLVLYIFVLIPNFSSPGSSFSTGGAFAMAVLLLFGGFMSIVTRSSEECRYLPALFYGAGALFGWLTARGNIEQIVCSVLALLFAAFFIGESLFLFIKHVRAAKAAAAKSPVSPAMWETLFGTMDASTFAHAAGRAAADSPAVQPAASDSPDEDYIPYTGRDTLQVLRLMISIVSICLVPIVFFYVIFSNASFFGEPPPTDGVGQGGTLMGFFLLMGGLIGIWSRSAEEYRFVPAILCIPGSIFGWISAGSYVQMKHLSVIAFLFGCFYIAESIYGHRKLKQYRENRTAASPPAAVPAAPSAEPDAAPVSEPQASVVPAVPSAETVTPVSAPAASAEPAASASPEPAAPAWEPAAVSAEPAAPTGSQTEPSWKPALHLILACMLIACIVGVFIIRHRVQEQSYDLSAGAPVLEVGETWTVDGQWSLTILSVTETSARQADSSLDPEAVYCIDYVYTNLGYDSDSTSPYGPDELEIEDDDFSVKDARGDSGSTYYHLDTIYPPVRIPVGGYCHAQIFAAVNHAGKLRLTARVFDDDFKMHSAVFNIDPEAEPTHTRVELPASAITTDDALTLCESWIVDGQWEFAIVDAEPVEFTDSRNSDGNVVISDVYWITYRCKNIGYTEEDAETPRLLIDLDADSNAVDAAGQSCYYYEDVTDPPESITYGEEYVAHACIGVSEAGTITLVVAKDDSSGVLRAHTFLIDP